jgi:hypothetical protein
MLAKVMFSDSHTRAAMLVGCHIPSEIKLLRGLPALVMFIRFDEKK